jgi:hypothetical protein
MKSSRRLGFGERHGYWKAARLRAGYWAVDRMPVPVGIELEQEEVAWAASVGEAFHPSMSLS